MASTERMTFQHVSHPRIRFTEGFWAERVDRNRTTTIPAVLHQLQKTGHIDALKLEWRPGDPQKPHIFWDSDLAKWMEAAAYSLADHPDPDLEAQMDIIIDLMEKAQQPDGYLNTHYIVVEPEKRWTNLRDTHELYCAGHLIEAAVAYDQATGKDKFLRIMRRYADYIAQVFGPGEGQIRGYDGHQEVELALFKLYRHTGDERYLRLSQFFIDERGRQPHFYDQEAVARGEDPAKFWARTYEYNQSHKPVREQDKAVGHSVRAVYMYSAMADLALETGDEGLHTALSKLWDNVVNQRMYVTGALGSTRYNEGWTWDYDLPNDTAYAETCAAIGLFLWAHRMLLLDLDSRYSDVMERVLYNGLLSSTNEKGDRFFYVNPLEVDRRGEEEKQRWHLFTQHRREWYDCACCPPNIARVMASLGGYFYSQGQGDLIVHHYGGSTAELQVDGQPVKLTQETNYPWDGQIKIQIEPQQPAEFTLRLRLPGWCQSASLAVNGQEAVLEVEKGYARLRRSWQPGDVVALNLAMPVVRVRSNAQVSEDAGKVALARGPVVYCIESADNGSNLAALCLPRQNELHAEYQPGLLGGVVVIRSNALREAALEPAALYTTAEPVREETTLTAIPYYAWDNRAEGEMRVWIREC